MGLWVVQGELAVSWSRRVVDKSRSIPTTIGFILLFSIVPGIAAQVVSPSLVLPGSLWPPAEDALFALVYVPRSRDDKYYEEN